MYEEYMNFHGGAIMDNASKINELIKRNEVDYIKIFSDTFENHNIIRFRDREVRDIRFYNSTHIKDSLDSGKIKAIIDQEMNLSYKDKVEFCRFTIDDRLPGEEVLKACRRKYDVEYYGNYAYDSKKYPSWKVNDHCEVRRVVNQHMIDEYVFLDMNMGDELNNSDLCERRAKREGRAVLSDAPADMYICYENKIPVAYCEIFFGKAMAKLENLCVLSKYRKRGIATTMLKHLVDIALKNKAETIYLVADEEDTVKEMYKNLGFIKTGESYAVVYDLK